jgi:dipeptidyl aminopeptidase/acylaminoacyl peptidase
VIVCKVCGTENEQGAGFCGSCGTFLEWNSEPVTDETTVAPGQPGPEPPAPLPTRDATATQRIEPLPPTELPAGPGQVVCPSCGLANEATRVYCGRCAAELAPATIATTPVHAEPPRARSVPPVAILGGVAAVALIGVVGAFVLLPRGTPTPSSAVTASVPVAVTASPGVPASDDAQPPSDDPPTDPPTDAPPSGPPTLDSLTGLVVFAAVEDGDADLWVWDPADDSLRPLVEGPGSQSEPAWAPDGSAVVYRAPNGLRMVRADGKRFDPPDFTHDGADRNPTWSPDGRRVVFATDRDPFTSRNIVARPADDSEAKLDVLVSNGADDWDPAFSPDGSTIVFASTRRGDGRLYLMDADGRTERLVALGPGSYDDPMFSPDGEWLAFTRRDDAQAQKDLWVARLDGSEMRQLTATAANENDLAWSPDGRVIVVARADDDGRLVAIDVATGEEIGDIGVDGARNGHPDWWWPDR